MLKDLQKALGFAPKADSVKPVESLEVKVNAEEIQAAVLAALESLNADFDSFKQTAEALHAEAELTIKSLQDQLANANAALAESKVAIDAANAEKVAAEALAAATKLAARKEKVEAVIGTERAGALLQVTEGIDDAAFEAVVAALGTGVAAEAEAPLFKEVGVTAETDASKVIVESAEMKILKAKYHGKK